MQEGLEREARRQIGELEKAHTLLSCTSSEEEDRAGQEALKGRTGGQIKALSVSREHATVLTHL